MRSLILSVLFTIQFTFFGIAQEKSLTVLNILGASVYAEPSFESQKIIHLDFGEEIRGVEKESKSAVQNFENAIGLEGIWFQVLFGDFDTGYIFSTEVTEKKISFSENEYGIRTWEVLGLELTKNNETKMVTVDGKDFPYKLVTIEYENGIYTVEIFDGCFDHKYRLQNFTSSEAFHAVNHLYFESTGQKNSHQIIPRILESGKDKWLFEGYPPTSDLTLTNLGQNQFLIESYDCD